MKAIRIVGYKNTGKTSFIINVGKELKKRQINFAIIKHTSEPIDINEKDSQRISEITKKRIIFSNKETALLINEGNNLQNLIGLLNEDLILVEGLKEEKTLPKIICSEDENEIKTLNEDGLAVCVISAKKVKSSLPIFSGTKDMKKLVDLILKKSFILPDFNCGKCGFQNCYLLAKNIVQEKANENQCIFSDRKTIIKINNKEINLNPFTSQIISNAIKGMLSALKGFEEGKIEIKIL